jgi:carbon monoxide dehydrogenase subunit G
VSVRIQGERHLDAPREEVFAALTDPAVVASTIPFVEGFARRGEDRWKLTVKPPLPIAPALELDFEVVEKRPPEHARLQASGGKLGSGVSVVSSFDLSESSGGTLVRFTAELSFSGVLAPAEKMLEPIAQRQAEKTLDAIESKTSAA